MFFEELLDGTIKINIKVKTQSNNAEIKTASNLQTKLEVNLTSIPKNNKANEELIKLLAKQFKVSQKEIILIKGLKTKEKVVLITNNSMQVKQKLINLILA